MQILPILLYACDTWITKKQHFRKREGFRYRKLRTLLNKGGKDYISYVEVIKKFCVADVVVFSVEVLVRKFRLRIFGKNLQMEDSRILKQILFGEVTAGKRKEGRPIQSWRSCLKQDLNFFTSIFKLLRTWLKESTTNGLSFWKKKQSLQMIDGKKIWGKKNVIDRVEWFKFVIHFFLFELAASIAKSLYYTEGCHEIILKIT